MGISVIRGGRSSGGGYQGEWAAGTYAQGSMVRRGIGAWATTVSTSQDPCTPEPNMGSGSWTLRGNASQSGSILQVTPFTNNQNATVYGTNVYSGWANRRLIVDWRAGGEHCAFGIYDSSLSTASAATFGCIGLTGCYGFDIDVTSYRTCMLENGAQNFNIAQSNTAYGAGNDSLKNAAVGNPFYRFYMDLEQSGSNMIMTVYRSDFVLSTSEWGRPGFIGQYTVAAPSFTSWRWVFGSVTFTTPYGAHEVSNAWTSRVPASNDWKLISEFPKTPHVMHSIF